MGGMDTGVTSPRVLVVDDDSDVLASLERGLRLSGFEVATAVDGAEALRSATENRPDAIVLDINMPVLDGVSVVTALRAMDNDVPVCVLSARSSVDDRVAGLEAGADDYLVKPFVLAELVARVKALLRRRGSTATSSSETITVGPLEVDIPGRRARVNGVDVDLTKREFDLLAVLAEHKTAVLSRAQLLELVWGYDFAADTNVVDVFIGTCGANWRPAVALGCCIPSAESDSCCVCSDGACMNILSRIFARTPSLRTRVVVATAIGAAIPVLIVGTVVWVGITNDRKERLDRRLDEAAGFAIPFVPRGLDEIPRSPNDQDALITVRRGNVIKSNSDITLPKLQDDYADTYVRGVRYRVRTVEIPGPEPTSVAVGATYDATVAETNNLHRRVLLICTFAIGAAAVFAWLLAAFAVRPFKQLAEQTRSIDAGDEAPRVEVHGASEAIEIAEAMRGMLQRIWNEQNRTKEALASARDFAAVSSHELRTPLTAMRTNLEVLSTLDLPDDQRKEVLNDVIRTQSRIEATLSALERLAQGELSTSDDHVPVDITDLLDRAAHDAARIYPDLDVSLVPSPTCIIVGLPAGLRLAVDNAIANAVKHGGATLVQLSAVSSRAGVEIAIDDNGSGVPEGERQVVFERFSRGSTASHSGSGLGLALVAQQAQLHGGTASLENSPLGGARLVLRLPGPS